MLQEISIIPSLARNIEHGMILENCPVHLNKLNQCFRGGILSRKIVTWLPIQLKTPEARLFWCRRLPPARRPACSPS
jgi:hypothetical protein